MEFALDDEEQVDYTQFIAFADTIEAAVAAGRGVMSADRATVAKDLIAQFGTDLPLNIVAALSAMLPYEDVRTAVVDRAFCASLARRLSGLVNDFDDTTAYFLECVAHSAPGGARIHLLRANVDATLRAYLDPAICVRHHWRTQRAMIGAAASLWGINQSSFTTEVGDDGQEHRLAFVVRGTAAILSTHVTLGARQETAVLFAAPANSVVSDALGLLIAVGRAAQQSAAASAVSWLDHHSAMRNAASLVAAQTALAQFHPLANELLALLPAGMNERNSGGE